MDSLLKEAYASWYRYCQRKGYIYQQPNIHITTEMSDRIILANCNGYLATYDLETRRISHRKKDARYIANL